VKIVYQDDLEIPHGNTTAWRYMGLDKFLDLLVHQRLFFTNALNFTDGYEVTLPENIILNKKKELIEQGFQGQDLENELARFEKNYQPMKELTLVNCWSLGTTESYALWKIYLEGSNAGMAIRTTVSALRKAIEKGEDPIPEDVYIGKVQYKEYLPEPAISPFSLVTTKREFYAYENELRLFMLHDPESDKDRSYPYNINVGRHVIVDLNILIDKIYISPFVGSWFRYTIQSVLKEVNPSLNERLQISSILDE